MSSPSDLPREPEPVIIDELRLAAPSAKPRFVPWAHQTPMSDFALARPNAGSMWDAWMGTGKTGTCIWTLERRKTNRALVLCPLSVVSVWKDQMAKWSSAGWEVLALDKRSGTAKVKAAKVRAALAGSRLRGHPLMVIVNYDSAWRAPLAQELAIARFDAVVLDESHKLKSPQGAASKWVGRFTQGGGFRLALTGTPMPHSPLDIFAQARALDPSVFGLSFVRFRDEFAIVDSSAGFPKIKSFRRLEELTRRMRSFCFKVDRSVLKLPPAMHNRVPIELSTESRRVYNELEKLARAHVADGTITPANGGVQLLRLQQITGGHATVDLDDWSGDREVVRVGSEKRDALEEILDELPANEPVVVFARFRADLGEIHAAAAALGRKSLELSGTRREHERWRAGEATVLAVQVQSGGVGIDLTRACYCVLFSLGFSLGDYEQILARVHRPGQERTTHYYHLVATDTADEAVYGAMRQKKNVIEAVLRGLQQRELRWNPQETNQ